jgi:hypothetical protein
MANMLIISLSPNRDAAVNVFYVCDGQSLTPIEWEGMQQRQIRVGLRVSLSE